MSQILLLSYFIFKLWNSRKAHEYSQIHVSISICSKMWEAHLNQKHIRTKAMALWTPPDSQPLYLLFVGGFPKSGYSFSDFQSHCKEFSHRKIRFLMDKQRPLKCIRSMATNQASAGVLRRQTTEADGPVE